ncbi:distal tail protein Dit [Gracilibacillus sp. D59]|uniref:distal tail protein Dit n=1 Tax=Gracilibacillus sp. D59 TaxID=3457434 RepID=UPI003FCE6A06
MNYSFSFNGIRKNFVFCDDEEKRYSVFAPVTRNLLTVAGKIGAYLESTETQVRIIEQPVFFQGIDDEELKRLEEDIAGWLLTDKPVPLVFDDEPNRTYFAVVDGSLDVEELLHVGQGTITFICPDPYKYGPEKPYTFPSDYVSLTNKGTAKSQPIFELEVLAPITFAMLQNQNNEYMMIGKPVDVDSIVFQEKELILHDPMDSLVGWTEGTQLDNGTVSGTLSPSGSGFIVTDWGVEAGTAKWYGPALKKSLSEQLQDFQIDIRVQNIDAAEQVGRVEMYLLDVNGNIIGRITLKDAWVGLNQNRGEARAGNATNGHYLLDDSYAGSWHDFRGVLRLERKGNEWTSYVAKIDDEGTHRARETRRFTDTENLYLNQVAQIQISIAKFGDHNPTQASIYDLKVWKLNDPAENEIPYIADVGDIITFDHINKLILINGEPRKDLKQFGASYFYLEPEENRLIQMPSNSFNTNARYREPYR